MSTVVVNAASLRTGGGLSIYRQFIGHLSQYVVENQYIIFIDESMDHPSIRNVEYVLNNNHSILHRLWWDYFGLNKWLKKNNITPDVVISLQNTGVRVSCKQIIYYHQALPFYARDWSFFKSSERTLAMYKYIYPYFVKYSLTEDTQVVVQIPYVKRCFIKRFKFDEKRVHVMFPDVEKIDVASVVRHGYELEYYHFIYPASAFPYKEHSTLVKALSELRRNAPDIVERIRIHFTLQKTDVPLLVRYIREKNLVDQFVFEGMMPHDNLLSYYKSSNGLLFPSTIETLGLPLLEAAAFGIPIVVSNLDYAHEVIADYRGAIYVNSYDFKGWAKAIESVCNTSIRYQPIAPKESSWKNFFALIK